MAPASSNSRFPFATDVQDAVISAVQSRLNGRSHRYCITSRKGVQAIKAGCLDNLGKYNPKESAFWMHSITTAMTSKLSRLDMLNSLNVKGATGPDLLYAIQTICSEKPALKEAMFDVMVSTQYGDTVQQVRQTNRAHPLYPRATTPSDMFEIVNESVHTNYDAKNPMIRVDLRFYEDPNLVATNKLKATKVPRAKNGVTGDERILHAQIDLVNFIYSKKYKLPFPPKLSGKKDWSTVYLKSVAFFRQGLQGDSIYWEETKEVVDEVLNGADAATYNAINLINSNPTQASLADIVGVLKNQYNLCQHDAGTFWEVIILIEHSLAVTPQDKITFRLWIRGIIKSLVLRAKATLDTFKQSVSGKLKGRSAEKIDLLTGSVTEIIYGRILDNATPQTTVEIRKREARYYNDPPSLLLPIQSTNTGSTTLGNEMEEDLPKTGRRLDLPRAQVHQDVTNLHPRSNPIDKPSTPPTPSSSSLVKPLNIKRKKDENEDQDENEEYRDQKRSRFLHGVSIGFLSHSATAGTSTSSQGSKLHASNGQNPSLASRIGGFAPSPSSLLDRMAG